MQKPNKRTPYCLGFLFDDTCQQVALIQKTKPEWQAGLWNGIGGKIEAGELPIGAMTREFREETGCDADIPWVATGILCADAIEFPWAVYIFGGKLRSLGPTTLRQTTEELPGVFQVDDLPPGMVDNVEWLIHYVKNSISRPTPIYMKVSYDT